MQITIRVFPKAKKRSVRKTGSGEYEVSVKSPPERNEANEETLGLITEHLGVPRENMRIVTGHRKRKKIIELYD